MAGFSRELVGNSDRRPTSLEKKSHQVIFLSEAI